MISVVVPIYNTGNYLVRCIDSVLQQTYSDIELILVDDGSTDNSGEICDAYQKKDRRIKVIHKKNGGLSEARNEGITCAKGEYIAFVDSDDYIAPNMLKILYDNLIEKNADISICNFWWIDEKEKMLETNGEDEKECFVDKDILKLLYNNDFEYNFSIVVAWNKLYKRSLFKEIRYPIGKLHEDEFIIHKLLYQCKKIVYSTCKLYYYMKHDEGITGNVNSKRIQDVWTALSERAFFFKTIDEKEMYDDTQKNRLYLAKSIILICEKNTFAQATITKKWMQQQMRQLIKDMKQKKIIDNIQFAVQLVWSYQPQVGDVIDYLSIKVISVAAGCTKYIRNICFKGEKDGRKMDNHY